MKMLKGMFGEDDIHGSTGSYSNGGKPQTSINMFTFQMSVRNTFSVPNLNLSKYKPVYTQKTCISW